MAFSYFAWYGSWEKWERLYLGAKTGQDGTGMECNGMELNFNWNSDMRERDTTGKKHVLGVLGIFSLVAVCVSMDFDHFGS